jgi:DNA-binding IclR family transcriptional regulator
MILGCFSEMPGLSLQLGQAARLFALRLSTCEAVLRDLVDQGKLRRARDGRYVTGQFNGVERQSVPTPDRHNKAIGKRGR